MLSIIVLYIKPLMKEGQTKVTASQRKQTIKRIVYSSDGILDCIDIHLLYLTSTVSEHGYDLQNILHQNIK